MAGVPRDKAASAKPVLLGLFATFLCFLVWAAAPALATAPDVTIGTPSGATYTTVHVTGEVDAQGEPTGWGYEVSDDGGAEWQGTNLGGFSESSGFESVDGDIEGLTAGKTYQVRLVATNYNELSQTFSAEPNPEFTTEAVPAPTVSIDPVSTHTGTTAQLSGSITANSPAGDPGAADVRWHFECSPSCTVAEEGTVAAGQSESVGAEATELEPNTEYSVRLVGKNAGDPVFAGPVDFTTDAVAPAVETVPAFALDGGTSALLGADVNPRNSSTTYRFEYGPTTAYGNTSPPVAAGSGGGSRPLSEQVSGLAPNSRYHFRVVARNGTGQSVGADATFTTGPVGTAMQSDCPNARLREENGSTALPDCRAYEMVSPVNKNGLDVGIQASPQSYVAAADGERVGFETTGALPGAKAAAVVNMNLSTRSSSGWTTTPIGSAQVAGTGAQYPTFAWFTPNLDNAVVDMPPAPSLAPGDVPGHYNLYLRDNVAGTYTTLNAASPTGEDPTGALFFAGADSSLRHFVFEAEGKLTPGAAPGLNAYERVGDQLRLVAVLPDGEPSPEGIYAIARTGTASTFNLVSDGGSRIVFETPETEPPTDARQLYVREDGSRTVEVSASHRAIPDSSPSIPEFWGASADGSRILFTSPAALTENAESGSGDLYAFNVEGETLEDLTAGHDPGEPAGVSVVGMSEDASYIYFTSSARYGQAGGTPGGPNLYLWHDGTIKLIATTFVGPVSINLVTARVTENGHFLVFESDGRLTAYDNTDAVTGAPDTEVYRYDAASGELTCSSCRPTGAPPRGSASLDMPPYRPVANQQRQVLEDGTVFFTSTDALLPQDTDGKADVYERKEGRLALISSGTSSGDVQFVGASADGRDVFFATTQELVPADVDKNRDVYDARVDGGFPANVTPTGCMGDECQGQPAAAPAVGSPGSASFVGPGTTHRKATNRNRAAKLRQALKSCRSHHHKKKQRRECEARVKRRFAKQRSTASKEAK